MPQSATLKEIKAYQTNVEKNKITPDNLPACRDCNLDSLLFKFHAWRERKFLVIVNMIIETVLCPLVRFKCPGCGKTFTYYPDFAIPYKRYTRQTIVDLAGSYVATDKTYQDTILSQDGTPGYEDSESTLAPSTIHRWITGLSRFKKTCQAALNLVLQQNPSSTVHRDLAQMTTDCRKYRSEHRRYTLIQCRKLVNLEFLFQQTFIASIFTKLAIRCSFC